MKFALLGADADLLPLARCVAQAAEHELVAIYDAAPLAEPLRAWAPQAAWADSWETLLHGTVADAVMVARGPAAERDDQLRKLVQAAVPLILVHPACEAIVGYELDMIRRDTGCVLVPYWPGRLHPALPQVAQMIQAGDNGGLGRIRQVTFERRMSETSRQTVLAQLARDADFVRSLLGAIHKVHGMGAIDAGGGYASFNVQMFAQDEVLAVWSLMPADKLPADGRLIVQGHRGQVTLTMPPEEERWTVQLAGAQPRSLTFPQASSVRAAIQLVQDACHHARPATPTWDEACRAIEVAESAERSRRRGRTEELYQDIVTEEGTFKGMMAAGGCGLLLLALLVPLAVAVAEGLRLPFREHPLWRLWPVLLVAPLALFLLLQTLRLLFPTDSGQKPNSPSS